MLKHKEPLTGIRFIKGIYYMDEVQYKQNKDKKQTDKQTVCLPDRITEAKGFILSNKDLMRHKADQLHSGAALVQKHIYIFIARAQGKITNQSTQPV